MLRGTLVAAVFALLAPSGGWAATKDAAKPAAAKPAAAKPADKKAEPAAPKVEPAKAGTVKFTVRRVATKRKKNTALRNLHSSFKFSKQQWKRDFKDATLADAKRIAALGKAALDDLSLTILARVLFVLDVEAKTEATALRAKLGKHVVKRFGDLVDTMPDIEEIVRSAHELYAVPCRGSVKRQGTGWPPHYHCEEPAKEPTGDPTPFLTLKEAPKVAKAPTDADQKDKEAAKKDKKLAAERQKILAERDKFAVPTESLERGFPTEFCAQGKCFGKYEQVAAAIYGSGRGSDNLPVFCAPSSKERQLSGKIWVWNTTNKVDCSAQWFDTLGGWTPWTKDGTPSSAPEEGVIPPYACFGSPHLIQEHMVVPAGGTSGGSGFHCRKRIFRVLAKKAERSQEDINANIAQMCSEMRFQVWGERYKDINSQYQKWCHSKDGPKDKSKCLPPGAPATGMEDAPLLPFMLLSREELLFFFGHKEVFCRADRKGLVHFLDKENHGEWAKTLTCNVARGLMEAGPFEEGVQLCALAPFTGEEQPASGLTADHLKARLHCWRYDRPTCEDISRDQTKDDIVRSNVFDAFDALREARRTRNKEAWELYDLKDAEKIKDWEEKLAFADLSKDEGTFGVKEFCRFVGNRKQIQCGYDKKSMMRHYELHKHEIPEGCSTGVCARGAYQRGYYCGLFSSPELFHGKLYWMCGIDVGVAGHKLLDDSRAICVGGARSESFQSSKGDKGSLQCYERRYRWGEDEKTEDLLRDFDWGEALETAAKISPDYEEWLDGGDEMNDKANNAPYATAEEVAHRKAIRADVAAARKDAEAALKALAEKDEKDLLHWATKHGHTLGHRASLRHGLLESKIPVIEEFKNLKFKEEAKLSWKSLGNCGGKPKFCEFQYQADGDKDLAVSKPKETALNDLIQEVASGSHAPDDYWFQSFRLSATEDGKLRIDPKQLAIVLRVHHLVEVLESARWVVLTHAKKYADAVFAVAQKRKHLSRIEVHEKARFAPIPHEFKGNIFCVRDPKGKSPSGHEDYVCASSPLLVAGRVEQIVKTRSGKSDRYDKKGDRARDLQLEKLKDQVKFAWCFGGIAGQPLFGHNPSRALWEKGLSSPFELEIPASVVGKPKLKLPPAWLKKQSQGPRPLDELRRTVANAPTDGFEPGLLGDFGMTKATDPKADPKAAGTKVSFKNVGADMTSLKGKVSASNWMKCSGFQYSDEKWADADWKREPKKGGEKPKAGAPAAPAGGNAEASEETSKIMAEVGGLIISVIKIVLPKFGDALEQIQNIAHAAAEFYDKYVKKFVEFAKAIWEAAKGNVDKARKLVDDARRLVDEAADAAKTAAVKTAGAPPDGKKAAQDAEGLANDKLKALRTQHREAEEGVKTAIKASQENTTIPNTGTLIAPMLEELLAAISDRVMAAIEPNARSLLSKGFKFLRQFLDPIAQSVISVIASIPFVGGTLAALGQVAYSMAMDALEGAVGDALMGLVERILSKLLRGIVAPILKAVVLQILKVAVGACQAIMGTSSDACPQQVKFSELPAKDRWIERALACPGKPIFDKKMYEEAVAAENHIIRTAVRMRKNSHVYAKDLADRYLARYGLSYDSWMAAVGQGATPTLVARAARIEQGLRKTADELQTRRNKKKTR